MEVGLPISVAMAGGRYEVDVLGARLLGNALEIYHIECGQLAEGKQSVSSIDKKFSANNCAKIESYFRKKFQFTGQALTYHKLYVASFWSAPVLRGVATLGVTVRPLPEFICNEVLQTIGKWKANAPQQPRTQGSHITLPQACWLLQLIDYLNNRGLLKCL